MEETGGNSVVNSNLSNKSENNLNSKTADTPLKWCSVSLSDIISRGKRLEASVFDVKAKQALNIISNGKYKTIPLYGDGGLVNKAHYGGRLKRNYVTPEHKNSIGFIGSSEMLDIYPKPVKYIVNDERVQDLHIKKGTVLLSRSGTIGKVTFCNKTLSKFLVSEHAIRLECEANSGYIYAFMKTDIGKRLICSNIYGAVIQQIEPEHLSMVPIPDAPKEIKEKIHNLIVQSFDLRDESNELIDEATNLLIEELKLPSISEMKKSSAKNSANVNAFSIKLSNLAGRVDASYHLPIVDTIVEHLKKYAKEVTTIGDERISKQIILAGVFKRTYVEEEYGYPFLGGKEITQLSPKIEKYLSKPIHKKRYEKELKVTENTILVTDRGTIGTTAIVPKHWDGYAVSQNVLKLVPTNNNIAGYIYIFLNSEWGTELVRRQTYGSVIDMIDNNSLSSVEIPLLKNQDIQNKINDLALEANQKRYEAYMLEQEALKIMNEEVIYAK